jgi:hypothetical protein
MKSRQKLNQPTLGEVHSEASKILQDSVGSIAFYPLLLFGTLFQIIV